MQSVTASRHGIKSSIPTLAQPRMDLNFPTISCRCKILQGTCHTYFDCFCPVTISWSSQSGRNEATMNQWHPFLTLTSGPGGYHCQKHQMPQRGLVDPGGFCCLHSGPDSPTWFSSHLQILILSKRNPDKLLNLGESATVIMPSSPKSSPKMEDWKR